MDVKGKRALVTGASAGIGTEFARLLAAGGADLVLTARRKERLEALADELSGSHKVDVQVISADLSDAAAPQALFDQTEGAALPIDILINNAGFGTKGTFADADWDRTAQQLQLNMVSLTHLTHLFLQPMKTRGSGWILNVASMGAYMPAPHYATYTAGKAYVRNFSEAVAFETRKTGVTVTCLCPGATTSEFMDVAGHKLASWEQKMLMPANRCAKIGLRALFRRRRNIVAGILNVITVTMLRFLPRPWITRFAAAIMGRG